MRNLYKALVFLGVVVCVICDDANPKDLVQICKSTLDLDCARKYFNENGNCKVVTEANENPLYEENLPTYLSNINLTVISPKSYLSNMDGDIEAFYFDKKTKNLVMSVYYKGVLCDTPDTIFAFSQKGKEPIVFTEYVNATYKTVLTAVIPVGDGITVDSLKQAQYSAFFPESHAAFYLGPKFAESKDPVVKAALAGLLADKATALKEIFRTAASYIFLAYLQNYICDFNLQPVLEKYDLTVLESLNDVSNEEDTQTSEPCSQSDDMDCVRNFFKEHGTCSVVDQPNDKPMYREVNPIYVPWINSTVVLTDAEIFGLDGKIERFYINKQTNNLVMSVKFDAIRMKIGLAHLFVHQRGRQPKIVSGPTSPTYPVTLTAVIPMKDGLTAQALKKAFVSEYFSKPSSYNLGSNFMAQEDSQIEAVVDVVDVSTMIIGQEIFNTEASSCFLAYLQKYICDFGLTLSRYQM